MPADIREHRLDNGLKVLIKPMTAAPVASVWIWYRVGSRCERPGITGISHWVEHMLFKGTPNWPKGEIMKCINRVGGMNNGFTRQDDTVYFETLPAEHLDLALRIEADRMTNSAFDPDEVASERSVIISEREGAENYPQVRLMEEVAGAAFRVHPYRWPVVGYKCDLEQITREDLFAYYQRFYAPENATLVLVGALDPEAALELARRRFGDIAPAAGAAHEVRSEEPEQCGERRVEVRRPGQAVYWTCAYHVPAHAHEDRVPLMVLEAVLSGAGPLSLTGGGYLGKSARLHDVLVNRKRLAVSASGHAELSRDPGLFSLWMMLRDGVRPEKAEAAMFREVERLQDKGPKRAELAKALRQVQAQVEYARDGITANAYMIGHFDALDSLDELPDLPERVAAVTAEDVVRVARTYLVRRNRTVGIFIPEGEGAAAAPASAAPHAAGLYALTGPAWYTPPGAASPAQGGAAAACLPTIRERVLDCGARVLGIESPESHCVAIAGFLRAGAALDPPGREGTAYLTARMLDQGTARKTCRQVAAATDKVGASIHFGAGADSTNFGGKCLPRDLPRVLALLSECLAESTAPEAELEKVREQTLTAMKADRDSTAWLAIRAALEALYPAGHPYHRDGRGTPETLGAIGREAVLEFCAQAFGPQDLTVVLVGPLKFGRMWARVEKAFGSWRPSPVRGMPSAAASPRVCGAASPGERVITVPGKSQCDLVVARMAVPRVHPDYYALRVAASIFGQFGLMGRIGERVRDRMGLAYYAYGSLDAGRRAGHWAVRAGVNPANVRRALDAIREETDRFCAEPVSVEELDDSVGSLVGSLALRMETSDSLAGLARDIAFHELPLDYLERYRAELRSVSRERVQEVARKYLTAPPVLTIAGPPLSE